MRKKANSANPFKVARLNVGLTQVDVASKLKVTQQAVVAWENGASFPRPEILKRLSLLYSVSTDILLGASRLKPNLEERIAMLESTVAKLERKLG